MFCFSKTCRTCKSSTNSLFTLTCNSQKDVSNLLFSMFPELMNSTLNRFMENLCVPCVNQLLSFQKFKIDCIESDQYYMRYLNQLKGYDACMHAELVCKLGIQQENCQNDESQIQPTVDNYGVQKTSSYYYGSAEHSSSTAENNQIDIIKHEICMSDIEEENNEGATVEEAISILGYEEAGCKGIRGELTLTNQEFLASNYSSTILEVNVDVNEIEIDCIEETVNLEPVDLSSNVDEIANLQLKTVQNDTDNTENSNVKLEDCQQKDNLSSITKNDFTESDFVKYEICVADKDDNYESLEIPDKNHHKKKDTHERIYDCDICKKSFYRRFTLTRHIMTHTGKKPYGCNICKKFFVTKLKRRIHERTHTGEKPYECNICKKRFSQENNMINHQRIHTGEKPYQCDICQKSFAQKSTMRSHKRTHTGEKPFECDICQRKFTKQSHVKRHKATHTGERLYQCDVCKMNFTLKTTLINHIRTHTGEKPYECDICKKSFSQQSHVIQHKRTHTGENPFECDICKKKFSKKSHVKRHKTTHTGEKLYQCDICRKGFSQKSSLNKHNSAFHLDLVIFHERTHTD